MHRITMDDSNFHLKTHNTHEDAQKFLEALPLKGMTGWYQWPERGGYELLQQMKKDRESFSTSYDLVLVIGIGGSYAGVMAIQKALTSPYEFSSKGASSTYKPILFTGHNLSEGEMIDLLDVLDQHRPLVHVISKSGTTTETSIAFRVIRQYLIKRFGEQNLGQRLILITDPEEGALRELAKKIQCLTYEIPDDVGGRFSVLTAVGLVPLYNAGYDVDSLLEGANALFTELQTTGKEGHPVLSYASARYASWCEGMRCEVIAINEPRLTGVLEWWKQLFGESEGKDKKGLFPASLVYSTDLHSMGQYMQDGPPQMLETFLSFRSGVIQNQSTFEKRLRVPHSTLKDDGVDYLSGRYVDEINQAAMLAALQAHSKRGLPCIQLSLNTLDEFNLGYLLSFFMTSCAISAQLLGVNPFDQPGVEAYKTNLFMMMGKPDFS